MFKKVMAFVGMLALSSVQALAAGGGQLVATRAMVGLSSEIAGPLAYAVSLIMIVVGAISWYRHHGDMGAIGGQAAGTLFIAGIALGAASLLGFIPGVAGLSI